MGQARGWQNFDYRDPVIDVKYRAMLTVYSGRASIVKHNIWSYIQHIYPAQFLYLCLLGIIKQGVEWRHIGVDSPVPFLTVILLPRAVTFLPAAGFKRDYNGLNKTLTQHPRRILKARQIIKTSSGLGSHCFQ